MRRIALFPRSRLEQTTTAARPVEARDAFSQDARIPTWMDYSAGLGYSPVIVTRETAVGIPAVARAISLVAETIADLPLLVYEGKGAAKRQRDDTWQYRLLAELPRFDATPFDFLCDIAACIEASGNAFIQKVKADGEVVGLIVIDPQRVAVKRENGEKRFYIRRENEAGRESFTAATIIHIRGFTVNGGDLGLSPIALHRQRIGLASASEQYVARFYGQGVGKKPILSFPRGTNRDQMKAALDTFVANHTGVGVSHLPGAVTDGTEVKEIGMSLEDAEYAESEKLNLIQVAHIFRIPPKFMIGTGDLNEWDFIALGQALSPRLRRITKALHTDADLFPDRALYPDFDLDALFRTDAKTKAEVEHMRIQDGSMLIDEARADRGEGPLPPIPDDPAETPGMVPQLTPVGGAPNPASDAEPA